VYTSPIGFAVTGDGTITLTSAWVANDADPYSPDTRSISTSTAGQTVTATVNASAPAVTLFYELQSGGGTFRYRFGAGAWSGNISTAGTAGVASLALTGVPASGGYTLTVETVSGSVILCGAQFRTTKGVRLDRIAWGGARASHYAAANATAWQSSLTAIAPKLVIIQLGTNDAAAYDAATFAGHIGTLITRIRTALPAADLLLVAVAERTDTPVHAMSDFAAALATIADSEQCGFVDLQRAFGDPADYVLGGPTNLFENTTHPNQDGYRRIGSVLVPIIESL
jgi:lysophospholipase L1-like esterase